MKPPSQRYGTGWSNKRCSRSCKSSGTRPSPNTATASGRTGQPSKRWHGRSSISPRSGSPLWPRVDSSTCRTAVYANRTYGGVGGGTGDRSPYPDPRACPTGQRRWNEKAGLQRDADRLVGSQLRDQIRTRGAKEGEPACEEE
jgi:hypothetical protein